MPRSRVQQSAVHYRRSPDLVVYWRDGRLLIDAFARSTQLEANGLIVGALDYFSTWRPAKDLARHLGVSDASAAQRLVRSLVRYGLLEASRGANDSSFVAANGWTEWGLEARFFHHATRNVSYGEPAPTEARLRLKASTDAPPLPVKRVRGRRFALPQPMLTMPLDEALRARRTWRRFGRGAVSRDALATLLGMTWGIQQWVDLGVYGRTPLTTSPSPGARHSIEAYVVARRIDGLPAGLYHYDPSAHALVRMTTRVSMRFSDYLPTQTWYDGAAALVFMTSVFARAQWRYSDSRTYRSLIAEVGHQAQTFCLVATALGLAPFCTMALADSVIERSLGIDGESEAVMYSVGVGTRPRGVEWAPWPDPADTPRKTPTRLSRSRPRP